ncbi:hypothetical protein [Aquisphaera insulae]|uniref:hypothetical protein n=1 Tax=Aquisphaera insulae TaxID=2712864 RepID=UPI0013EA46A8|nr:hypothetical protein [Aquisphaera insulae]
MSESTHGLPAWLTKPRGPLLTLGNLERLAIAVGVALRIAEFLGFRNLYLDERLLLENIVGRAPFDFHHVLVNDQMAPPGFLVVERLLVHLPFHVLATARLFPLLCGIACVFLMRTAARRYLDPRAVPIAIATLALGDHLLYYSAEVKQYSCDLLMALAALALASPSPADDGEASGARPLGRLAVFGLIAPWFSFTVLFVLAGIGMKLLWDAVRGHDRSKILAVAGIGLGWVVNIGLCVLLSRSILSSRDFIWVWWDFAFLPIPPHTVADARLVAESMANVFINPGSILSPLDFTGTAAVASAVALIGGLSLGRRRPGALWLLVSPLLFGLAASAVRQYPFHGRLVFYLVPTYHMLLAEGMVALGRRSRWILTLLLAAFFLYGEAEEVSRHYLMQPRFRTFDSHGDLKNDLLDELEARRRPRRNPWLPPGTPAAVSPDSR